MHHAARKHARLSASQAERFMSCPGSFRMEASLPDEPINDAAALGTKLHEIAERILSGEVIAPGAEEDEHVFMAQSYADYVNELASGSLKKLIEVNLDDGLKSLHPELGGTADAVLVDGDHLHVIDAKFGRNPVDAVGNKQLLTYALGAMRQLGVNDDISCTLHIFQPKVGVSKWTVSGAEVRAHGEMLKKAADLAMSDNAPIVPSDSACKWCRARSQCTARAINVLQQAGEKFGLADLGAVLPVAQRMVKWFNEAEERALQALVHGAQVPGFKLVEGSSRRRWKSDAMQTIEDAGLGDKLIRRTLLPITQAQLVLGKAAAKPILDLATERPNGTPVLAPVDDPRPSITPEF